MRRSRATAGDEDANASNALVRLTHDGLFKQRPAWSPDGQWLSFARHQGADIAIYVTAADGSAERRLTDRQEPEYDAVWSPDGGRIAFTLLQVSGTQGDVEVYTIAPDGTDLRPFATTQGKLSHEESAAWSPDGQQIAFTSTRDGNTEVYVARADGSDVRRLTADPALDVHPAWSPDGKRIAFATGRWGDLELAVVNPDGSDLKRLTTSQGLDDYPAWSPDGHRLAFVSNRDINYEVYVMDVETGETTNATRDPSIDHFPTWTPDGRLTFVSNRDGGFEIYVKAR